MTGPLKRTGFRASPEDAAFYRRFREFSLSSLRKGVAREDLLKELLKRGVPEKTAERILVAVEQENSIADAPEGVPRGRRKMIAVVAIVAFGCPSVYVALLLSGDWTLQLKYLVPAVIINLVLGAIVIQKLVLRVRGPHDLPPPPDRPV